MPNLLAAIEKPLKSKKQGIEEMDWEIHLTTAGRHVPNLNKLSCTFSLVPKESSEDKGKVVFEFDKAGSQRILEKLNTIDSFLAATQPVAQ